MFPRHPLQGPVKAPAANLPASDGLLQQHHGLTSSDKMLPHLSLELWSWTSIVHDNVREGEGK